MRINKKEFVSRVAGKTKLSQRQVDDLLNVIFDEIEDALQEGDSIMFLGFGVFEPQTRKSRKGRNPVTGKIIEIPEKKKVVFKASSKMVLK